MTLKETLVQLKSLGNQKVRAHNKKNGAGDHQFGVRHGDIRKLAETIKTNHELAIALWETGNIDAQLLAILLMKLKNLSADEMDRMVRSVTFVQVADWLNSYVVKNHSDKETLRQKWLTAESPWAARAGWSLTSERVAKNAEGLDLPAYPRPDGVGNGRRGPGSSMDHERLSGRNRNLLFQASQTRHRHRRETGYLSRLSRFQRMHLTLCPDLDQRNGASEIFNEIAIFDE